MSDNKAASVTTSFPVASVLGIVFVTLKLCGVIAWPWLWVLAPFWIPLLVFVAALILIPLAVLISAGAAWGIISLIAWFSDRK